MGKGDKKTKKGKTILGTYGNSRKKKAIKARLKRATQKSAEGGEKDQSSRKTARKKTEA